jgi:hypothetical protein
VGDSGGVRRAGTPLASHKTNWLRHAAFSSAFRTVGEALRESGVAFLPVKGLITSRFLYDDASARPLRDIDLRIRPQDFSRAVDLARRLGWRPKTDMPVLGQALFEVGGCDVDLEATIGPPGLCTLSVEEVLGRAEAHVEPFGFEHLWPELIDHALILVLNVFKDGLRSPPWSIEDLRRIAAHPRFDADRLARRAAEGHVRTVLWLVANWMAEEQGSPPWRAVRDSVGPAVPRAWIGAAYEHLRRRGWPPKTGLFVVGSAGDRPADALRGACRTAAGILHRRWAHAFGRGD